MNKSSRTVYGAAMQSAINLGKTHIPGVNSTLNEKFNIQSGVAPGANERHAIKYYVIGNGGHRAITGADGFPSLTPNTHQPNHAACFKHIPFVLREITNDLTIEQRAKYALRRQETHGGVQYFAYYAKRIDFSNVPVNIQKTTVVNGVQTTVAYNSVASDLNPTPLEDLMSGNQVVVSSGEYLSASAVTTILFDAADAAELRNVASILYADENYAVVSEIGVCGGVDRLVTGPAAGGNTINYNEAIACQIVNFVACYYQLNIQNNGFTFTADIGITEPMFTMV